METACRRCHSTIQQGECFCSSCGLPQLVYANEGGSETDGQESQIGAERDASSIVWSSALKASLFLAIPAGVLASAVSPIGGMGFLLAAVAAAWAVTIYLRLEHPAWITVGAGVRIGLVTGLMAAWLAFAVSGGALFTERFLLHQGAAIDQEWKNRVDASQQMTQQWMNGVSDADAAQAQTVRKQVLDFMLSPEGHAGIEVFGLAFNAFFLVCFATGGGAIGARWRARARRPQI